MSSQGTRQGFAYRPGIMGKYHFRVRELHLAETYVPLLRAKKVGAVKLDLVLRGIALLPQHSGTRPAGLVLPYISYQDLHDLCRVSDRYSITIPEDQLDDRKILKLKRNWVGEQLKHLEHRGAVQREPGNSGRPMIIVRQDYGHGTFDDPDGSEGNSYVTISGPVIAKCLDSWGTAEVAAYLAAMVADRYARFRHPNRFAVGGATWFEPLHWFFDLNGNRPPGHVRIGFSPRTLQRGLLNLRKDGLISWKHQSIRPDKPGHRFRSGRRNIYTNHFDQVDAKVDTPLLKS